MSWRTPSSRYVSALRLSETAVTPSDCSMQNATVSEYERSLPSSVMSVPCSVVITFGTHAPLSGRQNLARQIPGRRVRDRVVRVDDVELLVARDLNDLVGERQEVLRFAEQRIRRRFDPVEEQPRLIVAEPGGHVAAQDVDAMAARREVFPSSVAMIPLPPIDA